MRAVLDTNVLVSALVTPRGVAGRIFDAWESSRFEPVTSPYILDELARVLIEKIGLHRALVLQRVELFYRLASVVEPVEVFAPSIDYNDLPILGTAVAGRADCLVTGDQLLLSIKNIHRIPIITPRTFIAENLSE